jgi:ribosomal protein S14
VRIILCLRHPTVPVGPPGGDELMGKSIVDCQFNDSYAFREYPSLTEYQRIHQPILPDMSGPSRAQARRCEVCGELLDKWNEPLDGLVLTKRRYDISVTYDGVDVVSTRFRTLYEEHELSGLEFRQLPDDPSFFAIHATRTVEFDAERRQTRFENKCSECGHYKSVIGATPVFLKEGSGIGDREFVRTDLEFASGDEKSPMLLCGEVAAHVLREAGFKGLDLVAIDDA